MEKLVYTPAKAGRLYAIIADVWYNTKIFFSPLENHLPAYRHDSLSVSVHQESPPLLPNRTERSRGALATNLFLLWAHIWLCILSGIAIITALQNTQVPKTYELRLYLCAILSAILLGMWGKRWQWPMQDWSLWRTVSAAWMLLMVPLYATALFQGTARDIVLLTGSLACLWALALEACIPFHKRPHWRRGHAWFMAVSVIAVIGAVILLEQGNTFSVLSPLAPAIFAGMFLWLRFIRWHHEYFVLVVPFLLYVITFSTSGGLHDTHHYSYILSPVVQALQATIHPFAVDAQYGHGLTGFLMAYFWWRGSVTDEGLELLLKLLTFAQYFLVYIIASRLYGSRKYAFAAVLGLLVIGFYSQTRQYYAAPSTTFLRFGFGIIALAVYCIDNRILSERVRSHALAVIGTFGVLWSFESAVYTLPAIVATEWYRGHLRQFLRIFLLDALLITGAYLLPLLIRGADVTLSRYYEYALVYANGFGQIALPRGLHLWWFFPAVYVLALLLLLTRRLQDHRLLMLTLYGASIFTYFAGRAHPNNLYHIAIPFVLVTLFLLLQWQPRFAVVRQLGISAFLTVLLVANYAHWTEGMILTQLSTHQIFDFRPAEALLPFERAQAQEEEHTQNNCPAGYDSFTPYIQKRALALITGNDGAYVLYNCLQVHNAFGLSHAGMTDINPQAGERIVQHAGSIGNRWVLIEEGMLNHPLTQRIRERLSLQEDGTLQAEGVSYRIFRRILPREEQWISL